MNWEICESETTYIARKFSDLRINVCRVKILWSWERQYVATAHTTVWQRLECLMPAPFKCKLSGSIFAPKCWISVITLFHIIFTPLNIFRFYSQWWKLQCRQQGRERRRTRYGQITYSPIFFSTRAHIYWGSTFLLQRKRRPFRGPPTETGTGVEETPVSWWGGWKVD